MPRASFTHHVTVPRSADEIWEQLQVAETWSNIGPVEDVWDAEHAEDGQLQRYRWSTTVGPRSYRGRAKVVASEPAHLMRLDLDATEVVGTLTTRLSQNGTDATQLEVTLEIESRGTLSTLFFPVVSDAVGRGLPRQVEEFAAAFE
jgi:hypothetical protein